MEDQIDRTAGKFDPDELIDSLSDCARKMLKEKSQGHEPKAVKIGEETAERPKVVNMPEALRRGLEAEKRLSRSRKRPPRQSARDVRPRTRCDRCFKLP